MSKYLSILVVALLCVAGVANADLIHQYDPSTDTWEDQAGHAVGDVDLTAQGDAAIAASTGYFSKAFTFDGTGDYANGGSYQNDYSDLMIEMWVKFDRLTDNTGADQVIFEQGGSKGLAFTLDDAGVLTFAQGKLGNSDLVSVSFNLTTLSDAEKDDFIQIVGIIDRTNPETRLLVNGVSRDVKNAVPSNDPSGAKNDIGLGGGSNNGNNDVGGYDNADDEPIFETFEGQIGLVNVYDVPEPATMSLLALGGLGVLIRRRK